MAFTKPLMIVLLALSLITVMVGVRYLSVAVVGNYGLIGGLIALAALFGGASLFNRWQNRSR